MPTDEERREAARRLRETGKELKPCPFCGGEARMHVAFASGGDHSVGVYVECLECRSWSGTKWGDGAQEKAADAWNRRAERTCRDTDYDTKSITCSECGETTRNTLFWVDVDGGRTVNGHRPRFCSNCGAKVVDDD